MRRGLYALLLLGMVSLAVAAGLAWQWTQTPLDTRSVQPLDLALEPGTSTRGVAQAIRDAGVEVDVTVLYWYFRLSGHGRLIKAGSYEIGYGITPEALLKKLVRGEEALRSVTFVEGWTFRQMRDAMRKADSLKPDSQSLSAEAIMAALAVPGQAPEGRFFPDTYTYAKGSSDLTVLRRALRAMNRHLHLAWEQRAPGSVLGSPEQLLTLASIVEKETGRSQDRPLVASVFHNRLRIGMPLQTDPTVIYGLGERFDGNLRKRDLLADTPYNTYTRGGLPPTPIAMPGKASLFAAAQPAPSRALYFVARGDGSSEFSETLQDHNRAVNKYQRGQQ